MSWAQPLGEVEPIVWHSGPRSFTPADPCTFQDRCTPDDWLIWARMSGQWITAAGKAARTDAERFQVNAMAVTWGQLERDGRECNVLECQAFVDVFAQLAQRARGYVIAWGGVGVKETGAWDLQIPLPDWLGGGKTSLSLLPLLALGAVLFAYLTTRKKGAVRGED